MKHDYYADEKDAAKWTVALSESVPPRIGILQVSMIPDLPLPAPPHRFVPMPPDADAAVAAFFHAERQAIAQGAPRNAARIVAMPRPITFWNPFAYAWADRDRYFAQVLAHLQQREMQRRDVVLLDPCTGLSSFNQNPDSAHLDPIKMRDVWRVLRPNDVLMVFQYQLQNPYAANWQHLTRGLLAGALGTPVVSVRNCGLNDAVRFFCVTKT